MSNIGPQKRGAKTSLWQKGINLLLSFFSHFEAYLNKKSLSKDVNSRHYVLNVFYACLFITILSLSYHIYKHNTFEKQYHKQLISKLNTQLDETFLRYFSMIYGMRAVFSMYPDMSLRQWNSYSNQILYPKRYPGILGVTLIRGVPQHKFDVFLKNDQDINDRSFTIFPPNDSTHDEVQFIQYAKINKEGNPTGLNLGASPHIRKLLNQSRDDDKTKMLYLPKPKIYAQDYNFAKPVFVLFAPIYSANTQHDNAISRRENFFGWVAVPIFIDELFTDVLNSDPDFKKLHLAVSIQGTPDSLIDLQHTKLDHTTSIFPNKTTKTVAGLTFTLHTDYLYDGVTLYGRKIVIPSSVTLLLVICAVITLLATAFFWSILTMRQRAVELANRMTTDLFRQEQKYRALIQNAPGVIFSCTTDRNWRMNYLSDQFQQLTGYASKDFLDHKRRYIEIVHPDDIQKVEKTIGLKPKENHEYFLDYRIIHKNGTIRWMHERAKVVRSPQTQKLYLTGHFFDITEQKSKESEYRNLVNALENAVNGIAFINSKGFHVHVNEAYSEMMHTSPQDLQYKNFFDLLSSKDQENLHYILENMDDKKRELLNVEAKDLSGQSLYLQLVIVPAYSDEAHRAMIGFYAFAKDVSNDIRREKQLSEAVKAAEAANQTKSTFLATMSHELRTPLNAIIGYSAMLLEDAQDDGDDMMVGDLKKINNSGRHLLTLINDILDVSKLEAGKMTIHLETFEIQETAKSMMDIIYPAAEKNKNTVDLEIPDDIGKMHSDLTKLRQMVFNLLSNSCKFTKEGTITLSIIPFTENNREFISFAVSDTGIGITDEQLEKLFQPFSQADSSTTRNFGGTGLGLNITKKFSEILGGTITVESHYGEGTTFTITLPRNTRQEIADTYNKQASKKVA